MQNIFLKKLGYVSFDFGPNKTQGMNHDYDYNVSVLHIPHLENGYNDI